MKKLFLILAIIFLSFSSCKKQENGGISVLLYNETQCSDPWKKDVDVNKTMENINTYLLSNNIACYHIQYKEVNPEVVCLECTCLSGRIFYIHINTEDIEKVKSLGFKNP